RFANGQLQTMPCRGRRCLIAVCTGARSRPPPLVVSVCSKKGSGSIVFDLALALVCRASADTPFATSFQLVVIGQPKTHQAGFEPGFSTNLQMKGRVSKDRPKSPARSRLAEGDAALATTSWKLVANAVSVEARQKEQAPLHQLQLVADGMSAEARQT